jgi:hypothetical protein
MCGGERERTASTKEHKIHASYSFYYCFLGPVSEPKENMNIGPQRNKNKMKTA